MSPGSNRNDYDFGNPESGGASAPLPSDIARSASAAPMPSDNALATGVPGSSGRRGVFGRGRRGGAEANDGSGSANPGRLGPGRPGRPETPSAQQQSSMLHYEERQSRVRKTAGIAAVLAVLAIVSLFVDGGYQKLFDPVEVFTCYGIWFQRLIAHVTNAPDALTPAQVLEQGHMEYFRIVNRASLTLMTVLCGAVLAVAGSLYQMAFRNPIASPSMLGVSSAIQLGDMIVVIVFGTAAAEHLGERYLICYVCVVVVMAVLFGCARLMAGKGKPMNVVNLLLIAMILTQLIGVLITYYTTFVFTWEMWEVFNSLSEAIAADLTVIGWGALLATCIVGLVPIVLLRFRLNGLSFDDAEMRLLGIDSAKLRILALICGTVLLMGCQVQMGTVAMLALVIPHVSRMLFGAEFRKQFWGNVLLGAALLVLCRIIVGFIPFIGPIIPVSVILNFLVLPFFVWMLATQQRSWG